MEELTTTRQSWVAVWNSTEVIDHEALWHSTYLGTRQVLHHFTLDALTCIGSKLRCRPCIASRNYPFSTISGELNSLPIQDGLGDAFSWRMDMLFQLQPITEA